MATTPPLRQPIRSASTTLGAPPNNSKYSASNRMVVAAFWSPTRTKRHRLQRNTAQKTCQPPSAHQSMTRCSPGTATQGRNSGAGAASASWPRPPPGGSCGPSPRSRRLERLATGGWPRCARQWPAPSRRSGSAPRRCCMGRSAAADPELGPDGSPRSPGAPSCGWCRTARPLPGTYPPAHRWQRCPYSPSVTSMESVLRSGRCWLALTRLRPEATPGGSGQRGGDFRWPQVGTFTWPRTRGRLQG